MFIQLTAEIFFRTFVAHSLHVDRGWPFGLGYFSERDALKSKEFGRIST
jgi:hypothetical protein